MIHEITSQIFGNLKNNSQPIYMIIPGFLGNYTHGFLQKLRSELVAHDCAVYTVTFYGHEDDEQKLWNPTEMQDHLMSEFRDLKSKYPQNKIVIIAHSQGCAITLACHRTFDQSTKIILTAPAVFLNEIILPRIDIRDIDRIISSHEPVLCKVSQKNVKLLDRSWVDAYKNFAIVDDLHNVTQKCHIFYPKNDIIDKKNVNALISLLPSAHLSEIESNHWFDEHPLDLKKLVNNIIV